MGEIQRASELIRSLSLSITLFLGALMGLLLGLSFYFDWPYVLAVPAVLAVVYFALYHMNALFLAVVFFTPLSINIEEYVEHFGLYIPTEPLLFGIMLLLLFYQLKSGILEKNYFKHPLVILLFAYLAWIVICSVTSTHPLISFKSILARLWFIIPVFVFGPVLLNTERIVNRFFWALTIGTAIDNLYGN